MAPNQITSAGVTKDMAARRVGKEGHRDPAQDLDRFFALALDLLCIADTDGYFRRLNSAWEKLLGYTRAELMAKRFFDFIHPDDIESTQAAVAGLSAQREANGFINRYRCKDGTYRWLEWQSAPYGNLIYATARDITERKRAEEALRESENRYRLINDASPDFIYSFDREGRFTSVNRGLCAALRRDAEHIIGKKYADLGFADAACREWEVLQSKVCETGASLATRLFMSMPDGKTHEYDVTLHPLRDIEDALLGISGTSRDISDRPQPDVKQIRVSDIDVAWHPESGACTFERLPVAMMWIDTTLAGLMSGVQEMVGRERFILALESEGRKSVAADWQAISQFPTFREGFKAIANIAAVAGWGDWALQSLDEDRKECRFRVINSWEGRYQKALGVCWGSGMLAGKLAGYCSRLFGTNCLADQTAFIANGSAYDEFIVRPSSRTIEDEIDNLLRTDEATRADMAVALRKLEKEIVERKQAEKALRDARWRLESIIEGTRVGTWEWNVQTGETVFNETWAEMIGYTLAELAPVNIKTWETFAHPDDLNQSAELLERHFTGERPYYDCECRIKHKDGHWIWVHDRGRVITRTEDGKPLMMFGTHTDITERKQAEERLRAVSSRNEALLASVPDIIMEVDHHKVYTWANKAGYDFFGEDVLGHEASDYFVGEQGVYETVLPLFLGKEDLIYVESWQRRRDGRKCLLAWWCKVLKDAAGTVTGTLSVAHDITEQKMAAEALRLSEEKYSKAFDSSPDSIVITSLSGGTILDANAGFERATGYTREEALGKTVLDLELWSNPDDRAKMVKALETNGHVRNMEAVFRAKSGNHIISLISAETITFGGQTHLLANIRDITEMKLAQQELAQTKALLSAAIDQSTAGIIIAEAPDGRNRIVNRAALRIRGIATDPVADIPKTLHAQSWQVFRPDGTPYDSEELPLSQAILHGKTTRNLEAIVRNSDGSGRWVLVNAAPVRSAAGEIVAGVVVFADATEIKRAEAMLKSLVRGTSTGIGRQFFRSLVRHIAEGFGCRYAHVAEGVESAPGRVRTLAIWNGTKFDRNYDYDLVGTPGETIVGKTGCMYTNDVRQRFPHDDRLATLGVESFMGAPLFGAAGEWLGLLVVMDDKAIPEELIAPARSLMTVAAAQAAAEIERMRAYEKLRVANEQLRLEHQALTDKNIALQTILEHLEQEREEYRHDICSSVEQTLTPIVKKLRRNEGSPNGKDVTALEDALDSIIGAGVKTFEMNLGTLSPREAEICEQIIKGRSSKQIAELLNVSVSTIHKHRESVRRKLQVQNQDINLSTYLRNNKNR